MLWEGKSDEWHRLLGDCIEALGTREFYEPLLELIETQLDVAQCMVFSYAEEGATCLLSINFRARARGKHLAKAYLDQGHRSDPLVCLLKDLGGGDDCAQVVHLDDIIGQMPRRYVEAFYRKPGFSDKTAVLLVDAHSRLIVNFYYDEPSGRVRHENDQLTDTHFLLTARLIRAHFSRNTDAALAGPLSILSDRERQVCEGVLTGLKSETIAAHIGVAPNSVVTYRKRAYRKLGINSRTDLFALCRA